MLPNVSADDVRDMRRHHPDEGMEGLSPRYVMNRLSAAVTDLSTGCLSPLKALDVLWNGLKENVSLDPEARAMYLGFLRDAVREYGNRAVRDIQRAYKEGFEASAKELLDEYLANVEDFCEGRDCPERDMRELEKNTGTYERDREDFRREINSHFSNLKSRGIAYDHTSEDRLKAAIEAKLFPDRRTIERTLSRPRSASQRAEWRRLRSAVCKRLIDSYGYCEACADDVISYAANVVKRGVVVRTPKNEGVEWNWELNPVAPASS